MCAEEEPRSSGGLQSTTINRTTCVCSFRRKLCQCITRGAGQNAPGRALQPQVGPRQLIRIEEDSQAKVCNVARM